MELFFRKLGEGPPLIIIHGLYGSSDNWLSIGRSLSSHYTVWLIDQRNHGQSPHSDTHDYPSLRDDLISFMDRHGIGKSIIIGHSMGGKTAMFFAEALPERVEALIVIDIAPGPYKEEDQSGLSHSNILNAMMQVDFSGVSMREEIDSQLDIKSSRIRKFLLKNVSRAGDNAFRWRLNVPVLQANLGNVLEGLDTERYRGGEEIAGFPVLFIRGELSAYISDDDILVINQIFPMARVTTIPGAGHWLHVEKPELLLKTIRYFL